MKPCRGRIVSPLQEDHGCWWGQQYDVFVHSTGWGISPPSLVRALSPHNASLFSLFPLMGSQRWAWPAQPCDTTHTPMSMVQMPWYGSQSSVVVWGSLVSTWEPGNTLQRTRTREGGGEEVRQQLLFTSRQFPAGLRTLLPQAGLKNSARSIKIGQNGVVFFLSASGGFTSRFWPKILQLGLGFVYQFPGTRPAGMTGSHPSRGGGGRVPASRLPSSQPLDAAGGPFREVPGNNFCRNGRETLALGMAPQRADIF